MSRENIELKLGRLLSWAAKGLLTLGVVILLVWAGRIADDVYRFPVRSVKVEGELHYLDREQLRQVVNRFMDRSFFVLDLPQLREAIEAMPWVREGSVRRIWPDTVHIHVQEHRPVAYWNDHQLLTEQGILITPELMPTKESLPGGSLPLFKGPAERHREVMDYYQRFSALVAVIDREIREISCSERRSWELVLDNGVTVSLGREAIEERLQRLIWAYPNLANRFMEITSVDLRYTNGFSVQWKPRQASQS